MSVSEHPTHVERLLDRVRPSRRARAAADEAAGIRHLVDLLCPGAEAAPEREHTGRDPYGRTA
ncbi:hypothetical protein [Streptosporangium roseum]|uniref:hypothetical protein n=1 Tax=Streptosporangium roseum TaxID=2001 RepID=UPI0012DD29DC|nr:hypothetical protein [Streptosporangium roseum]